MILLTQIIETYLAHLHFISCQDGQTNAFRVFGKQLVKRPVRRGNLKKLPPQ